MTRLKNNNNGANGGREFYTTRSLLMHIGFAPHYNIIVNWDNINSALIGFEVCFDAMILR